MCGRCDESLSWGKSGGGSGGRACGNGDDDAAGAGGLWAVEEKKLEEIHSFIIYFKQLFHKVKFWVLRQKTFLPSLQKK